MFFFCSGPQQTGWRLPALVRMNFTWTLTSFRNILSDTPGNNVLPAPGHPLALPNWYTQETVQGGHGSSLIYPWCFSVVFLLLVSLSLKLPPSLLSCFFLKLSRFSTWVCVSFLKGPWQCSNWHKDGPWDTYPQNGIYVFGVRVENLTDYDDLFHSAVFL